MKINWCYDVLPTKEDVDRCYDLFIVSDCRNIWLEPYIIDENGKGCWKSDKVRAWAYDWELGDDLSYIGYIELPKERKNNYEII